MYADRYHAASIFDSLNAMRVTLLIITVILYKGPDYFPFQPRFGHMDLYGRKT